MYTAKKEISGCLRLGEKVELTAKWAQGNFLDYGNVLNLDYDDDYTIL